MRGVTMAVVNEEANFNEADLNMVIRSLRESSMDGYTLMSKTGLDEDRLVEILRTKLSKIVTVRGDLTKERIGKAYLSIPPSAQQEAERVLGALAYKLAL
jgi:hypothetical protein